MRGVSVKQRDDKFFVSVERYAIRSGWAHVVGSSHRSWVVTVDQSILDWLTINGSATEIVEDFIHDDYMCYFHFWFDDRQFAENFAAYLNTEWK